MTLVVSVVEKEEATDEEILWAFLRDHYLEASPLPPLVLLPFPLEDLESLAELLKRRAGRKVELRVPKKGEKARLLELAERNARLALETELKLRERRGEHPALKALQDLLGLPARPWRLEGYDISHLQGQARVFSIAVFEGGRPKRQEYRRMRLKAGNDDYAAMKEVLTRRLSAYIEERDEPTGDKPGRFAYPPQLLLVDGGKGQLSVAIEVVKELGLEDEIPVASLAKKFEEVFIPGQSHPVNVPRGSEALYMLQRIRDEAHRFANSFHRELRDKRMKESVLDGIAGLGESRRQRLLKEFGTLKAVKEAPLEQLQALPWLPDAVALAIFHKIHGDGSETPT